MELIALRTLVDALVAAKEGFLPSKNETIERLTGEIKAHVEAIEQGDLPTKQGAELCFLHGRALDCGQAYCAEAERLLSIAVKLEPGLPEVWKALAHCLWKKADLQGARSCYGEALRLRRADADALRSLSMLLRQMKSSGSGGGSFLAESLAVAKEALALGLGDASSWTCLGNAYLSSAFGSAPAPGGAARTTNPAELALAGKAYTRAVAMEDAALHALVTGACSASEASTSGSSVDASGSEGVPTHHTAAPERPLHAAQSIAAADASSSRAAGATVIDEPPARRRPEAGSCSPGAAAVDPVFRRNPDLHFNRASVQRYTEEYEQAVHSYALAHKIDPGLGAAAQAAAVEAFVRKAVDHVRCKGHVKPKRLRELAAALAAAAEGLAPAEQPSPTSSRGHTLLGTASSPPAPAGLAGSASSSGLTTGTPAPSSHAPSPGTLSPQVARTPQGKAHRASPSSQHAKGVPSLPQQLEGRRLVPLSALSEGPNPGVSVLLKPLAVLPKQGTPPATLVCIDGAGDCVALSVYHQPEPECARLNGDKDTLLALDPAVKVVVATLTQSEAAEEGSGASFLSLAGPRGGSTNTNSAGETPTPLKAAAASGRGCDEAGRKFPLGGGDGTILTASADPAAMGNGSNCLGSSSSSSAYLTYRYPTVQVLTPEALLVNGKQWGQGLSLRTGGVAPMSTGSSGAPPGPGSPQGLAALKAGADGAGASTAAQLSVITFDR